MITNRFRIPAFRSALNSVLVDLSPPPLPVKELIELILGYGYTEWVGGVRRTIVQNEPDDDTLLAAYGSHPLTPSQLTPSTERKRSFNALPRSIHRFIEPVGQFNGSPAPTVKPGLRPTVSHSLLVPDRPLRLVRLVGGVMRDGNESQPTDELIGVVIPFEPVQIARQYFIGHAGAGQKVSGCWDVEAVAQHPIYTDRLAVAVRESGVYIIHLADPTPAHESHVVYTAISVTQTDRLGLITALMFGPTPDLSKSDAFPDSHGRVSAPRVGAPNTETLYLLDGIKCRLCAVPIPLAALKVGGAPMPDDERLTPGSLITPLTILGGGENYGVVKKHAVPNPAQMCTLITHQTQTQTPIAFKKSGSGGGGGGGGEANAADAKDTALPKTMIYIAARSSGVYTYDPFTDALGFCHLKQRGLPFGVSPHGIGSIPVPAPAPAHQLLVVSCMANRAVFLCDPKTGALEQMAGQNRPRVRSGETSATHNADGGGEFDFDICGLSSPLGLCIDPRLACVFVLDTGAIRQIMLPAGLFV